MSDIWVIFLDTSGSMSKPFSLNQDYPGPVKMGEYKNKIEAAKDCLLKHIKVLRGGEVAVIGFNSQPYLVHRGNSKDIEQFEKKIARIKADGGTNISAALQFGTQLNNIQDYQVVSFLMITDGLDTVSEQTALECIKLIPSLRIDTILINPTNNGKATAEAISVHGTIVPVGSSIALDSAVDLAKECHIVAINQVTKPPNFDELRDWWHDILRTFDRFHCYAILLCLPGDEEAIKYLTEMSNELDLISDKDCLVLAFSKSQFIRGGFDTHLWKHAIDEQVSQGYSLEIAKKLNIKLTDFPCIVLFDDIRRRNREIISFKDKTANEIAVQMRALFTVIQDGIAKKEKPLISIRRFKTMEKIQRVNRSFWRRIFNFGEKTFQAAIEAWINATIK